MMRDEPVQHEEWLQAVTELANCITDGRQAGPQSERLLQTMPTDVVSHAACQHMITEARAIIRERTRVAERQSAHSWVPSSAAITYAEEKAQIAAAPDELVDKIHQQLECIFTTHNTSGATGQSKRRKCVGRIVLLQGEEREKTIQQMIEMNEESRREQEAIDQEMRNAIAQARDSYEARLRMEWTAELLASTFSLADGRVVTWGDATVADHQARVDMFMRNAQSNIEGAARHKKAINSLNEHGVSALSELVQKV